MTYSREQRKYNTTKKRILFLMELYEPTQKQLEQIMCIIRCGTKITQRQLDAIEDILNQSEE